MSQLGNRLHVLHDTERRLAACRYARVANKPYSLQAANETDFETHFTVVRYHDDQAVAANQVRARPPSSFGSGTLLTAGLAWGFDGLITGHLDGRFAVVFPDWADERRAAAGSGGSGRALRSARRRAEGPRTQRRAHGRNAGTTPGFRDVVCWWIGNVASEVVTRRFRSVGIDIRLFMPQISSE